MTERDARSRKIVLQSRQTQQSNQHFVFERCGKTVLRRRAPCELAWYGLLQISIPGIHDTHEFIEAFAVSIQWLLVLQCGDRKINQVEFIPS